MNSKPIIITLLCAACIGMASSIAQAEYDTSELEKLFTDKKQRAHIDAVRSGSYSDSGLQKTDRVKISGYVTRSNGKSVVWLNNKNTFDSMSVGNVKVLRSSIGKNKKVTVTVDGVPVRLRPGETWAKEAGISDIKD